MMNSRLSPPVLPADPRMHNPERRHFLRLLAALGLAPLTTETTTAKTLSRARIVIIGGGIAGSTCARYLKLLQPALDVTVVEPARFYLTCPMSNLVLAGERSMAQLRVDLRYLQRRAHIRHVREQAKAIDFDKRQVLLARGRRLPFDRLVVAPGIDMRWNSPSGYDAAASRSIPHAWKAGPQTAQLRDQLHAMRNGGVVGISIPASPFRCPPGPYERASLIAHYLKQHKPRSKILLLDANDKFSKQPLFQEAWQALYPGMIEWVPVSKDGAVRRVGVKSLSLFTELEQHRVAVANVIPAQWAGIVARANGLTDDTGWCPVDPQGFTSLQRPHTHILGDATLADPMPKSATSANSQAKACALNIIAALQGQKAPVTTLHNTCYSLVRPDYGISIDASYRIMGQRITAVPAAGGISPLAAEPAFRALEARYALGWYASLLSDSFAVP